LAAARGAVTERQGLRAESDPSERLRRVLRPLRRSFDEADAEELYALVDSNRAYLARWL
jgi:hypothetical protein